MRVNSIPSFSELSKIFQDEDACMDLLFSRGVILRERLCECGKLLQFQASRNGFRCGKKSCRKEYSLWKGTFFFKSHLGSHQIMHLGHLWLAGGCIRMVSQYTGHDEETVSDYMNYFRQLVEGSLTEDDQMIGGENITVEIDETKVGKRKYHRGHAVDGVWVLGGVERTEERKVFLVEVPDRSAKTLLNILKRHIRPGTIVHSDLWKGYVKLEEAMDVVHRTVNHSFCFVDPITSVHTNTIEGTWWALKRSIPISRRTRGKVAGHLFEFIWRRLHQEDLWNGFLTALATTEYLE